DRGVLPDRPDRLVARAGAAHPGAQRGREARRGRFRQAGGAAVSLLQLSGVSKRFGGLTANQDVSFSIEAGQIAGLIGPNGAGKTTAFNCVAGFYPTSEGHITLEGKTISGLSPEACARAG